MRPTGASCFPRLFKTVSIYYSLYQQLLGKADALRQLRKIVSEKRLGPEDLLYRMQKRATEPPMGYAVFKECLKRIDITITDA